MVLGFFGRKTTQEHLVRIAGISKQTAKKVGTPNNKLITATRKSGFYCYVNEASTVEEIRYYLKLGRPVIVNYLEPAFDIGHFAVVIGFNHLTKKLIMCDPDPDAKKIVKMPEREFVKRWHGGFQKHTRWMMVISKKPFQLGKQFYPFNRH